MTSTPAKVVGFLAGLAAVFVLALAMGATVGPVAEPVSAHESDDGEAHAPGAGEAHAADDGEAHAPDQQPAAARPAEIPGGLMVSQHGYTFALAESRAQAGRDVPVAFTIEGPDGKPVTAYEVAHDKRLHLIAVRRDFTGFQHVHPELDEHGVWRTRLDLTPGEWRLFADFQATGAAPLTLGADLSVPGEYHPAPSAGETRTAHVDGYTVTLDGSLAAGADAKLSLEVSKDGRPVTDLQPYLGAYGHLVALREGDLAYLHVHPAGTPGDGTTEAGPRIVFYAAVPSPGSYRLYLDFKHDGVVRTAGFALGSTGDAGGAPVDQHSEGGGHGGH